MESIFSYVFNALLTLALGLITSRLKTKMAQMDQENAELHKKVDKENRAIRKGVQSLLRDRMIQAYEHYYIDLGYCPIHVKDGFNANYEAYHNLGENGVMDEIHREFMTLPTDRSMARTNN